MTLPGDCDFWMTVSRPNLRDKITLRLGQDLLLVKKLCKSRHNLLREAAHRQTEWQHNKINLKKCGGRHDPGLVMVERCQLIQQGWPSFRAEVVELNSPKLIGRGRTSLLSTTASLRRGSMASRRGYLASSAAFCVLQQRIATSHQATKYSIKLPELLSINLLVDLSNAVDINIWQSRSETSYHRPRAAVIIFVVWRCLKSLNLCPRVYRRG